MTKSSVLESDALVGAEELTRSTSFYSVHTVACVAGIVAAMILLLESEKLHEGFRLSGLAEPLYIYITGLLPCRINKVFYHIFHHFSIAIQFKMKREILIPPGCSDDSFSHWQKS